MDNLDKSIENNLVDLSKVNDKIKTEDAKISELVSKMQSTIVTVDTHIHWPW